MNILDKLLVLYLTPMWYAYCLGVFVQDKMSRTNMRKFGVQDPKLRQWKLLPFTLVVMPLVIGYGLVIPTIIARILPAHYTNPFIFFCLITFIAACIYGVIRNKIITRAFKKPHFLSF